MQEALRAPPRLQVAADVNSTPTTPVIVVPHGTWLRSMVRSGNLPLLLVGTMERACLPSGETLKPLTA